MKLAVIGSRSLTDYDLVCDWINRIRAGHFALNDLIDEIISGGAAGADRLGARWAKDNGIKLTELIPDWNGLGKSAGLIRNAQIVEASDVVLCFWDGVSRGTQNSLGHAKRLKKPTTIVYF